MPECHANGYCKHDYICSTYPDKNECPYKKNTLLKIDVDEVLQHIKQRKKWNTPTLDEVVFVRNGKPLEIPSEVLDMFKFTGLNNIDLVTLYDWPGIPINQCDGCQRGLPIVDGIHKGEGYDMICCTKNRYAEE